MNKPTEDLIDEHSSIMLMLAIMKSVAEQLRAGDNVERQHLEKIVEFVQIFADKCHHAKEEVFYFPALVEKHANDVLVTELLAEHQAARDIIGSLTETLVNFESGKPEALQIADKLETYYRLISEHVRKENQILFPLAEKTLSTEEMKSMEQHFIVLEHDVIGPGKHEEYHRWLDELQSRYLASSQK